MLTNEQLTTNLKVARARLNLSQKETAKKLVLVLV
jgi:DNA-binding XRE family transcriptional regulator